MECLHVCPVGEDADVVQTSVHRQHDFPVGIQYRHNSGSVAVEPVGPQWRRHASSVKEGGTALRSRR